MVGAQALPCAAGARCRVALGFRVALLEVFWGPCLRCVGQGLGGRLGRCSLVGAAPGWCAGRSPASSLMPPPLRTTVCYPGAGGCWRRVPARILWGGGQLRAIHAASLMSPACPAERAQGGPGPYSSISFRQRAPKAPGVRKVHQVHLSHTPNPRPAGLGPARAACTRLAAVSASGCTGSRARCALRPSRGRRPPAARSKAASARRRRRRAGRTLTSPGSASASWCSSWGTQSRRCALAHPRAQHPPLLPGTPVRARLRLLWRAQALLPQVLLIRRAKEPSKGEWCFPGGSLELGELLAAPAAAGRPASTREHDAAAQRPTPAPSDHCRCRASPACRRDHRRVRCAGGDGGDRGGQPAAGRHGDLCSLAPLLRAAARRRWPPPAQAVRTHCHRTGGLATCTSLLTALPCCR